MNGKRKLPLLFSFLLAVALWLFFPSQAWPQCTPPVAVTGLATSVDIYGATMNGTVNANNCLTEVHFEYGLSTSYGKSYHADPNPLTGGIPWAVTQRTDELSPNTTYHFRVVAVNAQGTSFGDDMTFTTGTAAPTATTLAATSVGPSGALLNGRIHAGNGSTTVTFQYGPTTAYGSTVTADQSPVDGMTDTGVSRSISGLSGGTTYHFRVIAQNAAGTVYGGDLTFITGTPPTVTTNNATAMGTAQATLHGTVNPQGAATVSFFEYGIDSNYGRIVYADQSPLTGSSNVSVSSVVTGLIPNTLYHFRAAGQNASGTVYGSDLTFSTLTTPPNVMTLPASAVTGNTAILQGTVLANNSATTVTFQYGLTASYGTTVTAAQSPVSGVSQIQAERSIGGLTPDTTYHFRIVGQNGAGTSYGSDLTFFTGAAAPVVVTTSASAITGESASLDGIVNANNNSTSVFCEYGLSTTYGRSIAASPATVAGNSNVTVHCPVTDLSPSTVYHYRVAGQSGAGSGYGSDATFTTTAAVTTGEATGISTGGAVLSGTVKAGNSPTTVTFEYGPTTGYGTQISADPSVVSGTALTTVTRTIQGLQPGTLYHFRAVGQTAAGTAYGTDRLFSTLQDIPPPPVTPAITAPTLSWWSMVLFGLLLVIVTLFYLKG